MVPNFKMETAEVLRNSICKEEWVVLLDLTNTSFHVPIHKKSQNLMRFHAVGQSYQFRARPLSITTAALKFTHIAGEVKTHASKQENLHTQYLDDWLLWAPSQQMCLEH